MFNDDDSGDNAKYLFSRLTDSADIAQLFPDVDINAYKKTANSSKTTVSDAKRCEFVFARQTTVDGVLMKKGQQCTKEKEAGNRFCTTHQYATTRRKRKVDVTTLPKDSNSERDTTPVESEQSIVDQISSIQNQLETIKKRLVDFQKEK